MSTPSPAAWSSPQAFRSPAKETLVEHLGKSEEKYVSHLLQFRHFLHCFFCLLPSLFSRLFHSVIILLPLLGVVEINRALFVSDIPGNLPWHFHWKLYIVYNFWVSWGSWEFHAGVVFSLHLKPKCCVTIGIKYCTGRSWLWSFCWYVINVCWDRLKVCLWVGVYQLNRKEWRLQDIRGYRHRVGQDFITCVESFEASLEILRSTDLKMMQSRAKGFPVHTSGARLHD